MRDHTRRRLEMHRIDVGICSGRNILAFIVFFCNHALRGFGDHATVL